MRRKNLIVTAAVMAATLILPIAISLGLVNLPRLPILGDMITPQSPGPDTLLFDPAMNVTDYEDPVSDVTIGSTVSFNVNIEDVTDLYTWHTKVSWDTNILNGSLITYGDFLSSGTVSPNGTSSAVANITSISYDDGYGWAAESVLGDYEGVNGTGPLLQILFDIVGYGHTYIDINETGSMPTWLINSAGNNITFSTEWGYFRNVLTGDIQADTAGTPPDGDVDRYDFFAFAGKYGSVVGAPNYDILADLQGDTGGTPPDGDVDRYDFFAFAGNYGRSIVLP